MQGVAVGWQVYNLTGSALDLGLIGLAQFGPFVPLVLVAGHVADRCNRKWIIACCYLVEMLCAALLVLLTVTGNSSAGPVFGVMMLHGAARAFMMPATQAILVNLVPETEFSRALALNSSTFQVAVIVGPGLGGILYLAGPDKVYGTIACLLGISTILTAFTRATQAKPGREPVTWRVLSEGFRFVWSRPVILGAISLDLFAVLFGGATALLPAYARDILDVGPTGLGALRMAPAVGAAITAAVLIFIPLSRRVGRWMFDGVLLFGMATLLFALSQDFLLSLLALILMGVGDMISVYIRHNLIQLETPDAIRGRVSAINSVFIGASNELGEFESGLTAAWFGLVPALLVGGGATLLIAMMWMKWFPALRRMDRFPHYRPVAIETDP